MLNIWSLLKLLSSWDMSKFCKTLGEDICALLMKYFVRFILQSFIRPLYQVVTLYHLLNWSLYIALYMYMRDIVILFIYDDLLLTCTAGESKPISSQSLYYAKALMKFLFEINCFHHSKLICNKTKVFVCAIFSSYFNLTTLHCWKTFEVYCKTCNKQPKDS